VIAVVVVLVATSGDVLFGKYLGEALDFVRYADKQAVMLHLTASSIPAQVIPVFNIGFEVPPLSGRQRAPIFATTPRDTAWMIAGLCITAVVVRGMIAGRRRFLPEFLYLLAPLPLLAMMTTSTTRYLMSYQPIIWIAFIAGFLAITRRWRERVSARAWRLAVASLAFGCVAGIVAVRSARASSTAGAGGRLLAGVEAYTGDVASTFRALRVFLDSLPKNRTLLIGGSGDVGRFTIISDLPYYTPDRNLGRVAREKDVYAVLACGNSGACGGFDRWIVGQSRRIGRAGAFRYETVFRHDTPNARALVRRVIPAD
jgi:hypothetical protein